MKLPPWCLIEKTKYEMGYDPTKCNVSKLVYVNCIKCKKDRVVNIKSLYQRATGMCHKCSTKKYLDPLLYKEPDRTTIIDIMYSGSLQHSSILSKGRYMSATDRLNLYKYLQIIDKPSSNEQLRNACVDKLMESSRSVLFKDLSYILEKYIKARNYGNMISVADSRGIIEKYLHKLNFMYKRSKSRHILYIQDGSLYINNKWIHIGD